VLNAALAFLLWTRLKEKPKLTKKIKSVSTQIYDRLKLHELVIHITDKDTIYNNFIRSAEGELVREGKISDPAVLQFIKLNLKNFSAADSLFRSAKDLDALRFRAPEKINNAIKKLTEKYICGLVNIDSIFNSNSPDGIVGDNLVVDHLHPSLNGYLLMGKIYFEAMQKNGFVPNEKPLEIPDTKQDSIIINNFAFSKLDSIISEIRLLGLLNDWPFKENPDFSFLKNLQLNDRIDSIAYKTAIENFNWEKAHREAASWYLVRNDYYNFAKEFNVLVSQYPFKLADYDYAASQLISAKEYSLAYSFLIRRYKETPDAFSAKWLGSINLNKGNTEEAIKYFLESIKFDNTDAQVFYNLAGAYTQQEEYIIALESIEKCISLDPEYPNAHSLKKQLSDILNK